MSIGFHQTLCTGCSKLVPVAPGYCQICGKNLGETPKLIITLPNPAPKMEKAA